ncbi:MAG: hypothetical protein M3O28_07795 [Actinomycetota bacterium]|nr:hypothetical protein [Actinomycetota bacterium]
MALLLLLAFLVLLGLASALGHTADSRDPDYSLGLVLRPRTARPDADGR